MPCRIGITTNPDRRRQEWERKHPGLRHWRVLGRYGSKSEAQAHETRLSRQYGCEAWPGGSGPEAEPPSVRLPP